MHYIYYKGHFYNKEGQSCTPNKRAKVYAITEFQPHAYCNLELSAKDCALSNTQDSQSAFCALLFDRVQSLGMDTKNKDLYFSLHTHFYNKDSKECMVYLLEQYLQIQTRKYQVVSVDILLLAKVLQKALVYMEEYGCLFVIDNSELKMIQNATREELKTKCAILESVFGKLEFQEIESLQEHILPFAFGMLLKQPVSLKENLLSEVGCLLAMLKNAQFFEKTHFQTLRLMRLRIVPRMLIALGLCFCVLYPSGIFIALLDTQHKIEALQSAEELDFLGLEMSSKEHNDQIQMLETRNLELYQKLSVSLQSNGLYLSDVAYEIFLLLKDYGVWATDIALAHSSEGVILHLEVKAKSHVQITKVLQMLNTKNNHAKISKIWHKDNYANSEIVILIKEHFLKSV